VSGGQIIVQESFFLEYNFLTSDNFHLSNPFRNLNEPSKTSSANFGVPSKWPILFLEFSTKLGTIVDGPDKILTSERFVTAGPVLPKICIHRFHSRPPYWFLGTAHAH
jgi:hypothetical protein